MSDTPIDACPEPELQAAAQLGAQDTAAGLAALERLARAYPRDPRAAFLLGSFRAAAKDYAGALDDMARAVALAPGFDIARFQLGFLRLTSGDPVGATEAWGPLMLHSADHPLRLFAEGLQHLIRDEFGPARERLERGMSLNLDNAPLNGDMRLLLGEMEARQTDDAPSSSVHWLLQEAERRTRH